MKHTLSVPLRRSETFWGFCYLIAEFFLIAPALSVVNVLLPRPLDDTTLNFIFYSVNFAAVTWIFRRFLSKNLETMGRHRFYFFQVVLIGLGQYMLFNELVGYLVYFLDPGFFNANDAAIGEMVTTNLTLMGIATIFLVPPAEECLFRGLIFRNLYDKSKLLAWTVSVFGFAAIHIIAYVGVLTPMEILISFLQYVPAGISLAWAYVKADSIFAPILIHAIVNAIGISMLR